MEENWDNKRGRKRAWSMRRKWRERNEGWGIESLMKTEEQKVYSRNVKEENDNERNSIQRRRGEKSLCWFLPRPKRALCWLLSTSRYVDSCSPQKSVMLTSALPPKLLCRLLSPTKGCHVDLCLQVVMLISAHQSLLCWFLRIVMLTCTHPAQKLFRIVWIRFFSWS